LSLKLETNLNIGFFFEKARPKFLKARDHSVS
jgi:hypothetical protein